LRSRVTRLKPIGFTEFQFPTLVDNPPEGGEWIHEIKYDGYRTQIVIQNGMALIYTRTGIDWTGKYPHIAAAAGWLKCRNAIIDGEVILPHEETGKPDFQGLRLQITRKSESLVFVAFDLLHLNGEDIRPLPCVERRVALQRLLGPAEGKLQFSHHIDTSGKAFFAAVDKLGLEGIVSKLAGSAYIGGQVKSWLKIKCYEETDYEIAGVLRERGKPAMALMVDQERNYVGSAFITFKREQRERLWARVQAKAGPIPKGMEPKPGAEWLKPGLVGRVKHLKGEEKLRHATLKEFRDA